MSRLILIVVLLLVNTDLCSALAQDGAKQPTLHEIQAQLFDANKKAWLALDLQKSLELFREIREVTTKRRDEHKHLDVPEIDFILDALEKVDKCPPEQKKVMVSWLDEKAQGTKLNGLADHVEALKHHRESLQCAQSLFKEESFPVIDAKYNVAGTLLALDRPEGYPEGVALAIEGKVALEKLLLSNSYHYRQVLDVLARLYYK